MELLVLVLVGDLCSRWSDEASVRNRNVESWFWLIADGLMFVLAIISILDWLSQALS
jgi:hypothetical protein